MGWGGEVKGSLELYLKKKKETENVFKVHDPKPNKI